MGKPPRHVSGLVAGLLACSVLAVHTARAAEDTLAGSTQAQTLEALKHSGDLAAQRRFAWEVFSRVVAPADGDRRPAFETWYGEDAVFTAGSGAAVHRGFEGFRRPDARLAAGDRLQSGGPPILTYTLYNEAAYRHIRDHRLHLSSELARLRQAGATDRSIPGSRSVPEFPPQSAIVKTAWWPVGREHATPLPVWDPQDNPARSGGNDYMTWRRVVAVDPQSSGGATVSVEFAGQSIPAASRVSLQDFYHVTVDASLAKRLARDSSARKAALVVLGRPFASGDYLVLVGANLATKHIQDWVWATLWWHDRADDDAVARAERPATLRALWRHYLLQAAFDSSKPAAPDGGPHICFNPWLEGRFYDGGMGGGIVSNCQSCHRRASYPAVAFLPVTRGEPDLRNDPAYRSGQLRTSFIWSIAMHAVADRSRNEP